LNSNDQSVSWWDYATAYDYLCEINYHYGELLDHFSSWLEEQRPSLEEEDFRACDLGAGTGNFVIQLADIIPNAKITHWDWNSAMVEKAKAKYEQHGLNINIVSHDAKDFFDQAETFDLIVMINALYTFPNPQAFIRSCSEKLNHGGHLYIVDAGRPIGTAGWAWDLLSKVAMNSGLIEAIRTTWKLRSAIAQNRKIEAEGDAGTYWRHNLEDLISLVEDNGLIVSTKEVCYRGIADRVIAQKR